LRNVYTILIRKPEGKKLLLRPWHRWEDIRMDLWEIRWEGAECKHVNQNRDQWQALVNMGSIKDGKFLA
jgi:hypothetical protein